MVLAAWISRSNFEAVEIVIPRYIKNQPLQVLTIKFWFVNYLIKQIVLDKNS